ncbi:MAG: conjugal transfer pilus assembly protein TraW [Paraglaciecola sp.]|jgi:conjugal transfer pilus assembly protein TraW
MRFFKSSMALALCVLCATSVFSAQDEEMMNQEQAIKKAREAGWLDGISKASELKKTEKYVEEIEAITKPQGVQIVNRSRLYFENLQKESQIQDPIAEKRKKQLGVAKVDLDIFVSLGMPPKELRKAFEVASAIGARVLVRGVNKDTSSIMDVIIAFKKISKGLTPEPLVQLDPIKFKKYGVKHVPQMVYRNKGNTFKVKGSIAARWLMEQGEIREESEDFGVMGQQYEIDEVDIIELARQRNDAIDWKAERKRAINSFWGKQHFENLPETADSSVFYLDPTIEVTKDIVNQNGDVIAAKGTVVNPAADMPYQLKIMVFDATQEKQLIWAEQQIKKWKDKKIVIVSTRFDREGGWKHLGDMRKRLGREVKLLNRAMVDSFGLVSVPATVETENGYLKISQVGRNELAELTETEGE